MKLWFVNIGGYDPSSMQEKNEFGLIVAPSSNEAKKLLKQNGFMAVKRNIKMILLL